MPTLDESEAIELKNVLESGWIASGKRVRDFEDELCKFIGLPSSHGVAVSSGTAALFIALKAIGVSTNDEVIIPMYTCSAILNAVYMAGGRPIPVDINKIDFNVDLSFLLEKISDKTKAIIIVHTFGVPYDLQKLKGLDVPIIEDCAQAIGAKISNLSVGTYGDMAIFSFYASKVLTTGHGGMLVSKKKELVDCARDYVEFDCKPEYYPRFNFQMSDIEGGLGVAQMKKLNLFLQARSKIADIYKEVCKEKGLDYQVSLASELKQNWYRFVIRDDKESIISLKNHLHKSSVNTIIPIEKWELLHNYLNLNNEGLTNSEIVSDTTLSLPIYPRLLEDGRIDRVIESLKRF